MFPRFARLALAEPDEPKKVAVLHILLRITRVYAVIGVFVPVFGIATGASIGALGDTWLIVSMILTAVAALLLAALILPSQTRVVRFLGAGEGEARDSIPEKIVRRLGMLTGMFNLTWAVVVVLMIYRPGSTTGVGL
jgi:hypothetical protein